MMVIYSCFRPLIGPGEVEASMRRDHGCYIGRLPTGKAEQLHAEVQ
jgi:hypothetical protein